MHFLKTNNEFDNEAITKNPSLYQMDFFVFKLSQYLLDELVKHVI